MKCIGIKDGKIGGVYESFVIKEGNYYDYKKEIRYVFSWGNETGLSISEKVVADSINNGIYISKEDMNFSDDCGSPDLFIPAGSEYHLSEIEESYYIGYDDNSEINPFTDSFDKDLFYEYYKPIHEIREEKINGILNK